MEMEPSKNKVYFGLFLAVFVAVAVIIILFHAQKNPYNSIKSFDDCVKAGYKVMHNYYPEECILPNNTTFDNPNVP